jgi:cytochrome subunit of sulfide dehydrogenase
MKRILIAALACAPLAALSQNNRAAGSLAATCASCHGPDGRSIAKEVVSLAGLPKDYIVSTMKAFQDGRRPATVMHQIAKGYTDPQIELIAEYFAAQRAK